MGHWNGGTPMHTDAGRRRAPTEAVVTVVALALALAAAAVDVARHGTLGATTAAFALVAIVAVSGSRWWSLLRRPGTTVATAAVGATSDGGSTDALTGLGDRRRLLADLAAGASGAGSARWLAVLDLDGFRRLNDVAGHPVGDQVLLSTAGWMRDVLAADDSLYRVGADEFAAMLVVPDALEATAVSRRLLDACTRSHDMVGREVRLTASAGLVRVDGLPADTVRYADLAVRAAAREGGGRLRVFEPGMASSAAEQWSLGSDLRDALAAGSLALAFQPVFDLRTRRALGAEALARWSHPQRGPVSPEIFVPLAEESGLMDELGSFVLNEALRHGSEWRALSGQSFSVWVNLSVKQLEAPGAAEALLAVVAAHGLPPRELVLEVTEGLFMTPDSAAASALHRVRQHGVRVALDDFGTGYSSLSYLDRLPIDILKMDRQFVSALDDISRDPTTTRAVIELARALRLTLVAEGIETEEQLDALLGLGCTLGQGYLLQAPGPAAMIRSVLGTRREASPEVLRLT